MQVKKFGLLFLKFFLVIFFLGYLTNSKAQSVTVTAPANNTTYVSGATLTMSATIVVGGYTVDNVTFNIDGVSVGSDTSSPYSLDVNTSTLSVGTHNITATYNYTYYLFGYPVYSSSTTSTKIKITILPGVTTTDGVACGPGAVTLTAAGSPTGGTYKWYKAATGGTSIATGATYSPNITTATTYYVTYTVGGETTARTAVTGTIGALPTPSFTATSNVYVGAGATVSLNAVIAADNYTWDFGGGTPSTATGTGPFSISWTTTGTKTITLTETTPNGCTATTTQTVTVSAIDISTGKYAFSQPIALNTSAAGITTSLTNFPALVYIQENALKGSSVTGCTNIIQNPTGGTTGANYDFAFTEPSVNTNELPYQVESFNSTTGTLLVWVNIPVVNGINTSLNFYFGSASTAAIHTTAFAQATWASDYQAVYHFDDATASDATSNGNNGTINNTTTVVTGEVQGAAGITGAGAYNFDGSTAKLTVAGGINIPGAFTLSAWVKTTSITSDEKVMTNQTASVGGYKLGVYSGVPESETTNSINRGVAPVAPKISLNTWYYLQSVFSGTTLSTYVNGKKYQTQNTTSNSSNNNPFYIGVGEGGNQYYFNGAISEARVSSVAKSTDWLALEYYNQANPKTFALLSPVITGNVTNAAAINASINYNWSGTVSSDASNPLNWLCDGATSTINTLLSTLNLIPPQDGTSSLTIPTGTNYPVLPAGSTVNVFSLTMGAGAQLYLNGAILNVGCHIYNNGSPGGIISSGSSSASNVSPTGAGGINFNGTMATQYFYGSGTSTVNLASMAVSKTGTGFLDITGGPVNIYNQLLVYGGNMVVDPSGTLTLKSTVAGTANVTAIPPGSTITGNVTAERYIPGIRNYRLFTLPVNINNAIGSTEGYIDLQSLSTGMLTAGPGTGFSYPVKTANPLMYLYDESRAQNYTAFVAGKNVGIYSLTGAAGGYLETYYPKGVFPPTIPTATAKIPVGNSIQAYYVGPATVGNLSTASPTATTTTSVGYLNQGTIPVYIFSTGTKNLSYTPAVNTGATLAELGINQVGNPYASTIVLDSLYYDNRSANISPIFWELTEPGNKFVAYNAASHVASVSGSGAQRYITSGQGFFAQATSAAATLTFSENEKSTVTVGTSGTAPLMLSQKLNVNSTPIVAAQIVPSGLAGLHLKISKDTATYTQTGVFFNNSFTDKYSAQEDAVDMDASSPQVYLSSYSSDGLRLCLNELGDYTKGKIVKLYASTITSGTYTINLSDLQNIDTLYNVYLRDHQLNDSVNLRSGNSYTFTINTVDTSSYGANRFDLAIEREAVTPYQLLTFTGQKVHNGVQLNWIASNAGNYTGFSLQKQQPDNSFATMYTVQSNNNANYSYVDANPMIGDNIYRLAQNDIDGNISYSSVVIIGYNGVSSDGYFSVYPNPTKSIINVLVNSKTATDANYIADIFNTSGIQLDHRVLNTYSWTEDVSGYKAGVYIITLKDTNGKVLAKSKFIKVD